MCVKIVDDTIMAVAVTACIIGYYTSGEPIRSTDIIVVKKVSEYDSYCSIRLRRLAYFCVARFFSVQVAVISLAYRPPSINRNL